MKEKSISDRIDEVCGRLRLERDAAQRQYVKFRDASIVETRRLVKERDVARAAEGEAMLVVEQQTLDMKKLEKERDAAILLMNRLQHKLDYGVHEDVRARLQEARDAIPAIMSTMNPAKALKALSEIVERQAKCIEELK